MALQVVLERREADYQRPGVAERAQPHVDPEDIAVDGRRIEQAYHRLADAPVVVGGVERDPAVALGGIRIEKDQVDVRREIELPAAELAHADDDQRLRNPGGIADLAVALGDADPGERHRPADREIGKGRDRRQRLVEIKAPADVPPGDVGHDAAAQPAQCRGKLRLRRPRGEQRVDLGGRIGVDRRRDAGEQRRIGSERVGQEIARDHRLDELGGRRQHASGPSRPGQQRRHALRGPRVCAVVHARQSVRSAVVKGRVSLAPGRFVLASSWQPRDRRCGTGKEKGPGLATGALVSSDQAIRTNGLTCPFRPCRPCRRPEHRGCAHRPSGPRRSSPRWSAAGRRPTPSSAARDG